MIRVLAAPLLSPACCPQNQILMNLLAKKRTKDVVLVLVNDCGPHQVRPAAVWCHYHEQLHSKDKCARDRRVCDSLSKRFADLGSFFCVIICRCDMIFGSWVTIWKGLSLLNFDDSVRALVDRSATAAVS